jgi:hypothetical protein
MQKNTETLSDVSKEVGPDMIPEKTKYMLMSRCKKAGQKHSIKISNRSFEGVAKFKYIGAMPGNAKSKERLGRPRRRWEDGIRMDLREIA